MNFSRKLRGDCVHMHGQYRARDANDVGVMGLCSLSNSWY